MAARYPKSTQTTTECVFTLIGGLLCPPLGVLKGLLDATAQVAHNMYHHLKTGETWSQEEIFNSNETKRVKKELAETKRIANERDAQQRVA